MAYVVADPCVKCKFTDCVTACPVDCFHETPDMLVIDPEECIDCGACVTECPVEAIFPADDLPPEWSEYAELNARLARGAPVLSRRTDPHPEAEQYREVRGKRRLLDEARSR